MQNSPVIPQIQRESHIAADILVLVGEILFLSGIFIALLIILNYFNIIRLDSSFRFFRFLPHAKTSPGYAIAIPPTPTVQRAAVITPVIYGSANENKAKEMLQSFITAAVPSNVLPASTSAFTTSHSGAMRVFSTTWQSSQNSYLATLFEGYQGNPLILRRTSLFIVPSQQKLSDTSITAENAKALLPSFFTSVPPTDTPQCAKTVVQGVQVPYCQTTVNTAGHKISYGIFASSTSLLYLFACEIPKDSPYFFESSPCIADH